MGSYRPTFVVNIVPCLSNEHQYYVKFLEEHKLV